MIWLYHCSVCCKNVLSSVLSPGTPNWKLQYATIYSFIQSHVIVARSVCFLHRFSLITPTRQCMHLFCERAGFPWIYFQLSQEILMVSWFGFSVCWQVVLIISWQWMAMLISFCALDAKLKFHSCYFAASEIIYSLH